MGTVADLLAPRRSLLTIAPDETAFAAINKATARDVSALPVLVGRRLVGIVTERDFVRRILTHNLDPRSTPVERIMTRNLITVLRDSDVEDCMGLMIQHRIRHMLVVDRNELVGILSIRDMVLHVLREKQFQIEQMHGYIARSY